MTIDVSWLYTNIPHRKGIRAVKQALENNNNQEPKIWIILRLLHLILTKTAFSFNGKFYEQLAGTTMGTKCAPIYAILFMNKIETEFLANRPLKPLVWWQFIDDIFSIWLHGREELNSFITALNSFHPTIKITIETSETKINFLDTTIQIESDGKI